MRLLAEAPAIARARIDHAQVVERKRPLVPPVDDDLLARIVPPIRLQVGLLRSRQRGKNRCQPVDLVVAVEFLRSHASLRPTTGPAVPRTCAPPRCPSTP